MKRKSTSLWALVFLTAFFATNSQAQIRHISPVDRPEPAAWRPSHEELALLPGAPPITGTLTLCSGTTRTLANDSTGGTWTSSNTAVATVGASTGVVTGVTGGTATISYTLISGGMATGVVTVTASPTITGPSNICLSTAITLSTTATGGSWISSAPTMANVNSSGVVSGLALGTATISYVPTSGCMGTKVVTVNNSPSAGTILGTSTMCAGTTLTLTSTATGGTWSTSSSTVATVGSGTGIVNALSSGTAIIIYTISNSCGTAITTTPVNVNPAATPGSISGTASICTGGSTTLSVTTSGGSWSSSNSAVATVNSAGLVNGIAAGTATISYTLSSTCGLTSATKVVTVNSAPSAGVISGASAICNGTITTLTNTVGGGSWTSSNIAVATVGATGIVTAIAAGTATISYSLSASCGTTSATHALTVNTSATAGTISGSAFVGIGGSTTLTNTATGGSWISSNASVATVSSSGVVMGIAAGSVTISYMVYNSCGLAIATKLMTVSSVDPIMGTLTLCAGSTTTLSSTTSGGSWSSGAPTVATIDTYGTVTGMAAGTARITYSAGTSFVTTIVTVMPLPGTITGTTAVCMGAITTLGSSTAGGSWSSSNTSVATIGTSGIVSGLAAGSTTITYMLSTGCYRTTIVNINALPGTISGTGPLCVGGSTTLSNTVTGGTWSTLTPTVLSVGSATGIITGVAAGTATVTYRLGGACNATMVVTVNALPAAIAGTMKTCPGLSTTLTDGTTGGYWLSNNTSIATIVPTSGVVSGVSAGTVTMTYTAGTGCYRTATVTINPNPLSIYGNTTVCAGSTTPLFDSTTGGTSWTSSTPAVATIASATGVATGVSAGTSNITYTLSTGCYTTKVITVNSLPGTISGTLNTCVGTSTTLANTTGGGSWSLSNTAVAMIDSTTGIISGIATGTTVVTYRLGTSCARTATFTVKAAPAAIGGSLATCTGTTTTLTDASGGGTWISGNTGIATVAATSGVVTGVTTGTASITYTLSTGCKTSADVTVSAPPTASLGTAVVCVGSTTTLSNAMGGGTWSSSNNSYATVGSATGVVTGVGSGTVNITYSMGGTCRTTRIVTINAIPGVITGTMTVCAGYATTIGNSTGAGTWSSSNTSIATIGSINAVYARVIGIGAGTVTMSYTYTNGCSRTTTITVNATPDPGVISSDNGFLLHTVSMPTSANLSTSGDAGGTWISSAPGVASVNSSTGALTALTPGNATITYTISNSMCTANTTHTVNVAAGRPGATANNTTDVASNVAIFPNPNTGSFVIKGNIATNANEAQVKVTDMTGQVVLNQQASLTNGVLNENISLGNNLANGMYMLLVSSGTEQFVVRFVIAQ